MESVPKWKAPVGCESVPVVVPDVADDTSCSQKEQNKHTEHSSAGVTSNNSEVIV